MNLAEAETLLTAGLAPRCSTTQRAQARQLIRENDRIPAELALRIYANNVSGARVKSLAATYPACFRILGETCFNNVARRFIEQTPSQQPDLNRHGESFSTFLDDWTTLQKQLSDFRYLGDLARLEWLCHTACYAADDPPFDFTAFTKASHDSRDGWDAGTVAGENLRFRPGHSVGLLQSVYPVMEIRETNLSAGDAAEVPAGALPEYLVVSRPAFQPRVERVDAITFEVLAACRSGMTLGHIIDASQIRSKRTPEILPGLIEHGWITVDKSCTTRDT